MLGDYWQPKKVELKNTFKIFEEPEEEEEENSVEEVEVEEVAVEEKARIVRFR